MSWPEHFYKHKNHEQISGEIERPTNSLSARAMHLSIYGSMVCQIRIIILASYNKTLEFFQFYITNLMDQFHKEYNFLAGFSK